MRAHGARSRGPPWCRAYLRRSSEPRPDSAEPHTDGGFRRSGCRGEPPPERSGLLGVRLGFLAKTRHSEHSEKTTLKKQLLTPVKNIIYYIKSKVALPLALTSPLL